MRVREVGVGDLAGLRELYRHLNPDDAPCPPALAAAALEQLRRWPGSAVLVGCVGDALVASCTLVVIPNLTRGGQAYALIENVVTHAEWRGRGFGTAVLHAAVARAWEHGCYKAMLMTGSKNPATLAFYARAGFEQSKTGFQVRRVAARMA